MTMPFSPRSHYLSRYSQDIAPTDLPTDLVQTRQRFSSQFSGHSDQHTVGLARTTADSGARHLSVQGLRYRSEAYALASSLAILPAAPSPERPAIQFTTTPYDQVHQLHIRRRLQQRLAAAIATDNLPLVRLLQHEMQQAS